MLSSEPLTLLILVVVVIASVAGQCPKPKEQDWPESSFLDLTDRDRTEYNEGDTLRYRCEVGFSLEGDRTIRCINKSWTAPSFKCEHGTCMPPPNPDHGSIVETDYRVGNFISFKCHSGYDLYSADGSQKLLVSPKRMCQASYSWSSESPICKVSVCSRPDALEFGRIDPRDVQIEHGGTLKYFCNVGYKLVGASERKCMNGKWEQEPPTCEEITCPLPGDFDNGHVEMNLGNEVGSTIKYICKDGTVVESDCLGDGTWNKPYPSCMHLPTTTTHIPTMPTTELIVSESTEASSSSSDVKPQSVTTEKDVTTTSSTDSTGTDSGFDDQDQNEGTDTWVVVLSVCLCVAVVILGFVGFLTWKRKKSRNGTTLNEKHAAEEASALRNKEFVDIPLNDECANGHEMVELKRNNETV